MSLRLQAERDLAVTLEDVDTGFGWPITLTDPVGLVSTGLAGRSNDVGQLIDPDTGQAVSGRTASVTMRISSLTAQGFSMPVGIEDAGMKPWRVTFDDINGTQWNFKVFESMPDRGLGVVTCVLELWL